MQVNRAWLDNMQFYQEDCLTTLSQRIARLVSQPNTVVIFDNGVKAKEVQLYAQYIHEHGAFFVHDWPDEVSIHAIGNVLSEHRFQPLYHDVAQQLVSHLRFFGKQKMVTECQQRDMKV